MLTVLFSQVVSLVLLQTFVQAEILLRVIKMFRASSTVLRSSGRRHFGSTPAPGSKQVNFMMEVGMASALGSLFGAIWYFVSDSTWRSTPI